MSETTVLVVDDEMPIREMLTMALAMAGYRTQQAESGHMALQRIQESPPDLILLDWMLPGMSGVELARRLKKSEQTAHIPIIMLTALTDEDDKVQGLEAGADDYMVKPLSPRELLARLKAVLRRTVPDDNAQERIQIGPLHIDKAAHRVELAGQLLSLGPTEYRLLLFFATHSDRVYGRAQLLDQVWGNEAYLEERTVDVHIRRLRKALGSDYEGLIQTVRGAGYRFSLRSGRSDV